MSRRFSFFYRLRTKDINYVLEPAASPQRRLITVGAFLALSTRGSDEGPTFVRRDKMGFGENTPQSVRMGFFAESVQSKTTK